MLVTLDWMRENYAKYNDMLFGGKLPNIEFKIGRGDKTWGFAAYRYNLKDGTITPLSITVSNRYDSPEEVKLNTLIHEMIHIYDYTMNPEHFLEKIYDYWNDRYVYKKRSKKSYDAHGEWFQAECERVNKFGFKVSTNVQKWEKDLSKLSDKAQASLVKKKEKGAIVGFINKKNGKLPWFKIKTNERGMNEYIQDIIKYREFYSRYNNFIEWYKTYDIVNCSFKNTTKRGWFISELDKEFQVKTNVMQFIKRTDVSSESPIEKPKEAKKIFQIKTSNGVFRCDGNDMDKLFSTLKNKFPNMNDDVIHKIMNNPSNFITESRNKRQYTIIKEVIDEYVKNNTQKERNFDSSEIEGQRRFVKDLGDGEYIEAIE